jgi:hypothetical protein
MLLLCLHHLILMLRIEVRLENLEWHRIYPKGFLLLQLLLLMRVHVNLAVLNSLHWNSRQSAIMADISTYHLRSVLRTLTAVPITLTAVPIWTSLIILKIRIIDCWRLSSHLHMLLLGVGLEISQLLLRGDCHRVHPLATVVYLFKLLNLLNSMRRLRGLILLVLILKQKFLNHLDIVLST